MTKKAASAPRKKPATHGTRPPTAQPVTLLVGTRKGGFILRSDRSREKWRLEGPIMLGNIVHHMVQDPRDPQVILMSALTGHLGPTIFRSADGGKTWKEAAQPPAFPKVVVGPNEESALSVHHVFWLTPGHASQPRTWYAGSSPPGLFRSFDGGETWESVPGLNEHPMRRQWFGTLQDAPPGGATLHSIRIDPRDPAHIYFGVSTGGVFESTDGGEDWTPLNKGCAADFIPTPDPEYGHDPHNLQIHPLEPDRLYQQNHCGVYRMDRAEGRWVRIGENLPKEVGDIGFPIALHPTDPDTAWVFPMDGTLVWPRTNVSGKPAAYVTRDAGQTWKRQDRGLPRGQAWWNVKRQALATDRNDPVGVYIGTTNGEIYASGDEGATWKSIVRDLPEVFAVETAR